MHLLLIIDTASHWIADFGSIQYGNTEIGILLLAVNLLGGFVLNDT